MSPQNADYPVPFPHAIAAVRKGGEVIWSQGDLGEVFPLASVTKVLTALATMRAVADGYLSLDTVVGTSPGGSPYTVRDLLAHTSGLEVEGDGSVFRCEPHERRVYSNQGFELLGRVVEDVTRMPFADWARTQVFEPLGMESTSILGSPARSGISNAMDLSLVVEEFLEPRLFDPETYELMRTVVLPGLKGVVPGYGMQLDNSWGLGVEVKGDKAPHWTPTSASPASFGHFGVAGSYLWVDPDRQIGAVFLGREPFGQWHKENWQELGDRIINA